jgi:hypothetical protein
MFLVFFQKNKKYFTGSLSEKIISNKFEKLAGLLCLSYIFLEEKPKTIIQEIFKSTTIKLKDKVNKEKLSDKYTKLRQNDVGTFNKIFQHSSLPSINTQVTITIFSSKKYKKLSWTDSKLYKRSP